MTNATDHMLAYEAEEADTGLAAAYLAGTQSDFLAWCDEHDHFEQVTTSGTGPGYCTPISWMGFACGNIEVEGDHIEV